MKIHKKKLAAKVSILYYEENKSQHEIAKELNISRSYVSQLLTYAKEINLVKIMIDIDQFDLRMIKDEIKVKSHFPKLKQLYIMSSDNVEFSNKNIGKFAAPYITELIRDANVIGLNLGFSIEKVIKELRTDDFEESSQKVVVQTMGGFTYNEINSRTNPNELVSSLSKILKAESYYLNCPAILQSINLREELFKEASIKQVEEMWNKIDLALIGLGVINEKSRLFNLFDENMINELKKNHVKADLNANFFDSKGNHIPLFDSQKMSIGYKNLIQIKNKVVIAYGDYKMEAIISALDAGMIDILITDSLTIELIKKRKNIC